MQNYLPRFLSYEEWQRNEREKLKPQMPWEISNKGGGQLPGQIIRVGASDYLKSKQQQYRYNRWGTGNSRSQNNIENMYNDYIENYKLKEEEEYQRQFNLQNKQNSQAKQMQAPMGVNYSNTYSNNGVNNNFSSKFVF